MKTHLILAAIVFAFAPILVAEDDSPIEDHMEAMGKSFKQIKKQVGDPAAKDALLKSIASFHKHAAASADYAPETAHKVPQKDRAKFIADYKAAIADLVATVDKLQKAVSEGRIDDAKKLVGEMKEAETDGHSEFRKKEKHGRGEKEEKDD